NGRTRIHLTLDKPDGSRMVFVLDADDNYAVISYSTEGLEETVSRNYGAYQSVSGRLVPTVIEIEKRDAVTNSLLAQDSWIITSIDPSAPSAGNFLTSHKEGAQIEYSSAVAQNALYNYSPRLDTDLLLAERLSFATSQDGRTKNCATAALRYAALRLGRNISGTQLAQIVDQQTGGTSLLAMKEFVHRQGLYCRAVRTDIATLQSLTDCQAILHIPHKSHFVLLGDIDSQSIWTIDLAGRKFCSRADVSFFGMDWADGTALLISDAPITGAFDDIDDSELANITGRSGYTCTKLIQEDAVIFCLYEFGECPAGYYTYWPERWGCEQAQSGMCFDNWKLRLADCMCILNAEETDCTVDGNWYFSFTYACY
ncbi:MAG: cysteine peptidase family C39 domain-containing protein, partial [Planctomycetota bacterium]